MKTLTPYDVIGDNGYCCVPPDNLEFCEKVLVEVNGILIQGWVACFTEDPWQAIIKLESPVEGPA